jgi:hypothetical protein
MPDSFECLPSFSPIMGFGDDFILFERFGDVEVDGPILVNSNASVDAFCCVWPELEGDDDEGDVGLVGGMLSMIGFGLDILALIMG